MENLPKLEKTIGVVFDNKDLLLQAFIHRSYLNENPNFHLSDNERLEFLGDAVLELVVTESLYHAYPQKPEGELTNWRASLVNAKMLAKISNSLDFNDFLLLSKGEAKEIGKARQDIMANAFEALIGAIYIDQGYAVCQNFLQRTLITELPHIIEARLFKDPKSHFQEKAQEQAGVTPNYKVLEDWGPDHAKHFVVGIFLGEDLIAKGEGLSKQEAEEHAAKNALEIKGW